MRTTKRIAHIAGLLIMSLGLGAPASAQEPTYRVVVTLKATEPSAIAESQRRAAGSLDRGLGQVTRFYSSIPAFAAVVTRQGWSALSRQPEVASISLDEAGEAESIRSNGNSAAHALSIDRHGLSGKGITIALIDTGVDTGHRDLSGVVVDEACFCMDAEGNPCCPDGTSTQMGKGSAQDDNGHGTHLAGIIAGHGKTQGLAPKARIVSIKIASATASTSVWAMLAALDWIATTRTDVQVVNMSMATAATYAGTCDTASPVTSSLAAVGRTLRGRGVVMVAAAGNSGLTNRMSAPACLSDFVSVGAVYSESGETDRFEGCSDVRAEADQVACFSNSSSGLSLLAPGTGILSAGLRGGQAKGSGTSQAAAVVSGAAALLLERTHSGSKVEDALRTSGSVVTDQRNGRRTPRVDTGLALASLGEGQ